MRTPLFHAILGLALLAAPIAASAQAVISNGTVRIGVRADGALMPDTVAPLTGITYLPTGGDGLTPGCLCEAWGIANATTAQSGYTGAEVGTSGITSESFASTATTATAVANAFGTFRVTHSFSPSAASPNLYEVKVTIENISGAAARVLYGRAMDWDIPPTTFAELVTLQRGNSPALVYTSNDGFFSANPLGTDGGGLANQNFTRSGPDDHGAHFRFDFGTLAAGAKLEFTIAYGAAGTQAQARTALDKFGAESYSLGEPSSTADGSPNTFIFGFKGTGGSPIGGGGTGTCAEAGYTLTKLAWCRKICEEGLTGKALEDWIHRWIGRYRELPACALGG